MGSERRWEFWSDEEGIWLGLMRGESCLELYGPFDTIGRAEEVWIRMLRTKLPKEV